MREDKNEYIIKIILVEDNAVDARIICDLLLKKSIFPIKGEAGSRLEVKPVTNGMEALDLLREYNVWNDNSELIMVLLELNLPDKNGMEILREIKTDPLLQHTPVIILSASSAAEDIQKAYGLHANAYLVKPASLDQFDTLVQTIKDFWLDVVSLPKRKPLINNSVLL